MNIKNIALIAFSFATLQGCVALAVVGVVGGTSVAVDNRTVGTQLNDQQIELEAHSKLSKQASLDKNTNIQVISVNNVALVVGQAPTEHLRDEVIKVINNVQGIQKLQNQIRIGNIISITTKSNDLWLTSKVKTALFGSDHLEATNIKVVTENGEVFLMGLVTEAQANAAVNVARNISGVNRVFKMFEYLEKEN